MYTDGSKKINGVGAAVWDESKKYSLTYKLPDEINIYVAEGFAIWKSLGYAMLINQRKILVLTDSESVLKSIQSSYKKSFSAHPIILEIIYSIQILQLMGNI